MKNKISGKIKKATKKDSLRFQDIIYGALDVGLNDEKEKLKLRKHYSLNNIERYLKNSEVFATVYKGRVIGTGRLTKKNEIRMIYVDPKFHKQGFGTKMIVHLQKIAKKRGIKKMHLSSLDKAIGFYLKNGFIKSKNFKKRKNRMEKNLDEKK